MTTDEFDDYDDAMPPSDQPVPRSVHPDEMSREELRAKYLKPGFGFWMAVVWCKLFLFVMIFVGLLLCGIPTIMVAMAIDAARGQQLNDPKEWMTSETGILASLVVLIGSHFMGLMFGWLVLRWQCGGRTWKRRIALSRGPTLTHIVLVIIGFPALYALGTLIEQPIMKYVPSMQDLLNWANINFEWPGVEAVEPLLKQSPLALAMLGVAIIGPINEELWCRGFLGQGLSFRYKGVMVAVITSFLFGCIHLEPRQGLWAMLLGMAIYGAYVFTRSLWVAIGIHTLNNGLAVLHSNERLNFPVLQPLLDLIGHSPILLTFGATLLFAAVAYALYQTRCKLAPLEPGMPTWEPKGVSSVELPPPNSGTVVTHDPISSLSVALVLAGAMSFGMVMAFA